MPCLLKGEHISTLFASYLLMLYAETMSGRAYPHYFMPLFPYYGLLAGYLLSKVPRLSHPIVYSLALIIILWNVHGPLVNLYSTIYAVNTTASVKDLNEKVANSKNTPSWTFSKKYTSALKKAKHRDEVHEVSALVTTLTTANDRIYAHRLGGWFYLTTDRTTATRYASLPAMNLSVDSEITQTFFSELETNKPKVIISDNKSLDIPVDMTRVNSSFIQYLNDHYHEVKKFNEVTVFERN
ncbi:MAG: hypothetical protein Q4A67_06825 [Aerococcus sp.]|nr:hypothetical protein [Aerococcus sp.]